MVYRKIINLLDNASNQLCKFGANNWIEINDQSRGTYNTNSDIRFKNTMLKSSFYDYSDVYILAIGAGDNADARQADERNKGIIYKN